jgi:hypothetical protein
MIAVKFIDSLEAERGHEDGAKEATWERANE